jgi:tungstate transport system substrate-binding protein
MKITRNYSRISGFSLLAALCTLVALAADAPRIAAVYGDGTQPFLLATGSPGELGLLEALALAFAKQMPATLKWVKAGSGESLDLLKNKQVDVIMVHAPAAEAAAVKEGWAVNRTLIGSNEFYIVGPANDPAKIKDAGSAAEAYRRIAAAGVPFITRADNSGTHKKEMQIWKAAGVESKGDCYIPTHDFMTASPKKANEVKGYFMTDNSTWFTEKAQLPNITVLFSGDKTLVNTYHALVAPPGATPDRDTAVRFVEFLGSSAGQNVLRNYGRDRYGEGLYQDAKYAEQYIH